MTGADNGQTLLEIGARGSGEWLSLSCRPGAGLGGAEVRIDVENGRFTAVVQDRFRSDEIRSFVAALASPESPRTAVLGGDRAAKLSVIVEATRGTPGVVLESELVRSEDDPYPFLRFLVFASADFADGLPATADRILRSM